MRRPRPGSSSSPINRVAASLLRLPQWFFGSCFLLLLLGGGGGGGTPSSTIVVLVQAINGDVNFNYESSTDISQWLKLASDVRDMRLTTTTMEERQHIYTEGNHSKISLASLSLTANATFAEQVPIYNLYVAAFRDLARNLEQQPPPPATAGLGDFDGAPVEQYADTLVLDLFELGVDRIEGTGAVVYNVLMAHWGHLWKMLHACHRDGDAATALQHLDTAVALWIGEGQIRREKQRGYFLYSLSQFAGVQFEQDEAESLQNSLVLEVFATLQATLRSDAACQSNSNNGDENNIASYPAMRWQVQLLVQYANTVLVQLLLHSIQDVVDNPATTTSDFVELYSLAVGPQVAACDAELHRNLTALTVRSDVTAETRDAAVAAVQASYPCLGIGCGDVGAYLDGLIPQCVDRDSDPSAPLPPLAGYRPTKDVRDVSHLDRDIRQIDALMSVGAFSSALDYYEFGWNSDVTLREVASGTIDWATSPYMELFRSYYSADDTSVDALVRGALAGNGAFATADRAVRRGVVTGTLQGVVMYLGVTGQIASSLTACSNTELEKAQTRWDSAAALMVGSAEGANSGGQFGGQSLFAVSKLLCEAFDTCEPTSSVVDTIILASLQSGASALEEGECEIARQMYTEKIEYSLPVPLVQGLLYYTVEASDSTSVAARGYLLAYTKALLPFVNDAYPDAVSSLQINYDFYTSTTDPPVIDVASTFEAVRLALPGMKIDCQLVGKISVNGVLTGVCSDDAPPPEPAPSAPTAQTPSPTLPPVFVPEPHEDGLAWGRYTFVDETVAVQDSMFTLDVRDMWNSATPQAAETIYTNPSEHATDGLAGRSEIQSLQDFSTKAYMFMSEDPVYNYFRVALFEDEAFEEKDDDQQTWPYADAVEELAIGPENGNSAQLAAETVIVMEVWMMIANRLYDAVRSCGNSNDAPELVDSAVGLWIGQEQAEGKFNSGWSIYSKAQEAIQHFGMSEQEAPVNAALMDLFVEAQSLAKTCSSDADAFLKLRSQVDGIIRNLSIPLVQHLFYYMGDNNFEHVELYALSFVPQVVSVDMGAYEFLRDRLFEGFNWQTSIDLDLFSVLAKALFAMRISCEDLGDSSGSTNTNLIGLVDAVCDEMNRSYRSSLLAEFQTSVDVTELARIDLDVLQIDLFMRAKAYESALDVYKNGRNARKNDSQFYTLKDLATSEKFSDLELAKLYKDFFLSETYPDVIIGEALINPEDGRFAAASRRQLSEAVRRTLQTMVMYLQIHWRLSEAIEECTLHYDADQSGSASLAGAGQGMVDEAVALYVGSIEGPFSGGNPAGGGQMLYSLAKQLCPFFNTCETHNDAESNVKLLFAFADAKENLDNSECAAAQEVIEDNILPSLQIPLIQGVLFYASYNEGIEPGSGNETLVAGAILTETILPQIDQVNETSAVTIFESMDFDLGQTPVREGAAVVFDAFSSVLREMGIDCISIGSLTSGLTACPGDVVLEDDNPPEVAPPADTPVTLGDNLYQTTTFVQDRADIAKDVAEMKEEIERGRMDFAKLVYREGHYSEVYDDDGKLQDDPRAFAKFSKDAANTMQANPLYQMTVYALQDENGHYLGAEASQYADTIVELMFDASADSREPLAAEAAVALNLWMELANELFETVSNCKNKVLTDSDGIHSIDEAVAYWVGDGQTTGSDEGHLLYALAENMAQHFSISASPHSRTNGNILRLFHQAKLEMTLTNACTQNVASAGHVRRIVDKIVSHMMIVNIQALIHYLRQDDERERVRIYAHAVVPLIAGCSPKTFKYLKEKLLDVSYLEVDVEQIIASIRRTLPCFGLTCADIGVHTTEPDSACTDPSPTIALAGYMPANDVRAFAEIDLDILELDIMMQMEAYEAATDLYNFGKHVSLGASGDGTALSLQRLATNSGRISTPQYDSFRKYFNDDDKYADTIIRQALSDSGNTSMSSIQRRTLVTGVARHMILYMASLESMYDAIGACSSTEPDREGAASTYWDMAAAFLIGSLESHAIGGSNEGILLWGSSKQLCDEFNTCSQEIPNSSNNNDKITMHLYSGRGAVIGGNCDALKKTVVAMSPLLQVPLLQASFSSITQLSERNPEDDKERIQAEAYIRTQSLLPLISVGNHRTAAVLEENLPLQGPPLRDGVREVTTALAESITDLGLSCEDVGSSDTVDSCSGNTKSKENRNLFIGMGVLFASIAAVGIFLMLRSKRKNLPENTPLFVKSQKGELNHTSDLLVSRTAGSSPGGSDKGEDDDLINLNDADSTMESDEGDEAYVRAIENALSEKLQEVV